MCTIQEMLQKEIKLQGQKVQKTLQKSFEIQKQKTVQNCL